MLILTRKPGEEIEITVDDKKMRVVYCGLMGHQVRLGFEAPEEFVIVRTELIGKPRKDQKD